MRRNNRSEKNLEQVSHDFQYSGYDVETMIAKRVNHLQVQKAAATTWKERRARINTISPGVIASIRTGQYKLH